MIRLEKYYEMLKEIQGNPYSYLKGLSLKNLRSFLLGYELSAWDNKVGFTKLPPEFDAFVRAKYGFESSMCHFLDIIEFCESNEEVAFNKFFVLVDEFQKRQNYSVKDIPNKELRLEYSQTSLIDNYYMLLNESIRNNPKLYLTAPSLKYLEVFLNGYFLCTSMYQIPFEPHKGFGKFVQKKYGMKIENNPFKIIEFEIWYDEEKAFYTFFELLDEFLEQRNELIG
jgi:hypothetical protein